MGPAAAERHDSRQLFRRHGPQTVRRHAHGAAREPAAALRLDSTMRAKRSRSVTKRRLARAGLGAAETAVCIKGRQERERDAGLCRRGRDAPGELAGIGERHACFVLVQVVKLADAREARLQHLRERERRDRLELLGIDPRDEPVHQLAPGPEAVFRGPAALRQARDGALKGVTVQIGQSGDADCVALIVLGRLDRPSRWCR